MNQTIREARAEDASGIARAQVGAWHAAYKGIISQDYLDNYSVEMRTARWETILTGDSLPGGKTFVMEAADGICGFASIADARDEDVPENTGELVAIYVHPDFWSQRCGHALHKQALEALARNGYDLVILWVLEGNARARAFYQAHGWSEDGARATQTYGDAPAVVIRMTRSLREADAMANI